MRIPSQLVREVSLEGHANSAANGMLMYVIPLSRRQHSWRFKALPTASAERVSMIVKLSRGQCGIAQDQVKLASSVGTSWTLDISRSTIWRPPR